MRRILILICVLLLASCIAGEAIAALSFLPENGLVLDDKGDQDISNDQFWIADLSLLTNMTYEEQIAGIQSWNMSSSQFYDAQLTPWHMASDTEMQVLLSYNDEEIMDAFLPSEISVYTNGTVSQYSGRYDSLIQYLIPDTHEIYGTYEIVGELEPRDIPLPWGPSDDTRYSHTGAWVTASYSATAVPIQPSFYLLVSGLIGLVGLKLKLTGAKQPSNIELKDGF